MRVPKLLIVLLLVLCFGVAGHLQPWFETWSGGRRTNVLSMMLGDSRRLFANHFFAKADSYFHSGYYPSIFDKPMGEGNSHMEEASHAEHEEEGHDEHHEEEAEAGNFLGKPRDWIDAFGRNFYPSSHSHLADKTNEREILPWLRLTAELDPHKVETYVIASFTLRSRLGQVDEAEVFLREGLRANPDSYEILFELGRIHDENRHDAAGARNLWELALKKWLKQEAAEKKPDVFVYEQIVGYLARLEEQQGNYDRAIFYYEKVKAVSPAAARIQQSIDELKARQARKPGPTNPPPRQP
jgi:tetratricopeptide (TPR) repeat protein